MQYRVQKALKLKNFCILIINLTRLNVYGALSIVIATIAAGIINIDLDYDFFFAVIILDCIYLGAFVFNDIEDRFEDEKDDQKRKRNPFTNQDFRPQIGYILIIISWISALFLSAKTNMVATFLIIIVLMLLFLYSWRKVRLKRVPILDNIIHILVSGGVFFVAYFIISNQESPVTIKREAFICAFTLGIGSTISLFVHQLYEFDLDQSTGITTTTVVIKKTESRLILSCLIILEIILLIKLIINRVLTILSLATFILISSSILLPTFFSQDKRELSKKIFPWAINLGALVAILVYLWENKVKVFP